LEEELKKYENKFTSQEELFIYIGSWNVGGKEPKDGFMFFEWLFPMKDMRTPDIYILGLQEIVDLNAKNIVLSSNTSKVDYWRNAINKHMNEIDKYVVLKTLDLVGIFFIVYVKEALKDNVKNIDSLIVRTGLLGTMGNKGSCLLRFNYLDTSFSVSVAHLSAGSTNVNARITEINDILNRPFPNKNTKFKDHDIQFIFGDLNFRIDLEYNTCKQMIHSGAYSALNSYDQLNKAKSVSTSLIELDEGPLNFDPTYKYIMGTSEYDAKKKRVPSWCDRILFKKSPRVEVIDYNRIDYTISDHKPIYGLYKVYCSKIDQDAREDVLKELREKTNIGVNLLNLNGDENQNDLSSKYFLF
jgi:synaptojanin